MINENKLSFTFRVINQGPVVDSSLNIQTMDASELSLMPKGLLNYLSENEVVDLCS